MLTITLPRSVWDDYLDPACSGMQAEMELPKPTWKKVGKGSQAIYEGVTLEQAEEVAEYLWDRGDTLIGNEEPEYRGVHRRAMATAERIRAQVKERSGSR